MANRQIGFTLVEIAIVLIIVGLMLGGVMKGQELIDNAKVKNFANDFRNLPLLLYGYQDRYKALPGDDAAVDVHLGAALCPPSASCKATSSDEVPGNGIIEGAWNSTTKTDESFRFWQHVRLAGLAPGPADVDDADYLPRNAAGGRIGIASGVNSPIAGLRGTHVLCSRGILGKFAKQVDIALDDGNTAAGTIQVMANAPASFPAAAVATGGANGIDNDTPYTVCMGF